MSSSCLVTSLSINNFNHSKPPCFCCWKRAYSPPVIPWSNLQIPGCKTGIHKFFVFGESVLIGLTMKMFLISQSFSASFHNISWRSKHTCMAKACTSWQEAASKFQPTRDLYPGKLTWQLVNITYFFREDHLPNLHFSFLGSMLMFQGCIHFPNFES